MNQKDKQLQINQTSISRQLAVYGDSQLKIATFRIFLYGQRGIGAEVCKNLLLAGPAQVTLYDPEPTQIQDLGSNFYLNQVDASKGLPRAQAVFAQMASLNPQVELKIHSEGIDEKFLKQFDVCVFTDLYHREQLTIYNEICRKNKIGFIYGGSLGLYGFIFVDFGDEFQVYDKLGLPVQKCIIQGISQDEKAQVTILDDPDQSCDLEPGDTLVFKEVQGMTEINGKPIKVDSIISQLQFCIDYDTRDHLPYLGSGTAQAKKAPENKQFKSLDASLESTQNQEFLQLGLMAILEFFNTHKSLPALQDQLHAKELQDIVISLKQESNHKNLLNEEENEIIANLSLFARAQISPVASFFGGQICQEIIKWSGKFDPLNQWMHAEFFNSLPDFKIFSNNDQKLIPTVQIDRTVMNCRYDDMISIYGRQIVKQLHEQNVFLVGVGALGCEYLKMLALMGVSMKGMGTTTLTDDDRIEVSNLNRQFLFRKEDIGQSKSERASCSTLRMNPEINHNVATLRADPNTENFFSDKFWQGQDVIITALDNTEARRYVDSRCVYYAKPLLESGTEGTKASSQVIIPYKTQSYNDKKDPEEAKMKQIPMCTLKTTPYKIDHTIQWAREYFETNFTEIPIQCMQLLSNSDQQQFVQEELKSSDNKTDLRKVFEIMVKLYSTFQYQSEKYEGCVRLAIELFQDTFHDKIVQLMLQLPQNLKIEGSDQLYWSSPKRFPTPLQLSLLDEQMLLFVKSTANLYAHMFGLQPCLDAQEFYLIAETVLAKLKLDHINKLDKKQEEEEEQNDKIVAFKQQIQSMKTNQFRLYSNKFEKDDDDNFHIDFISAAANLRARNYRIDEIERFQVHLKAGNIIAAIATTTAMIVGAMGIEFIKLVQRKPVEQMSDTMLNLAFNWFLPSPPSKPIYIEDNEFDEVLMGPIKAVPSRFSTWDKIEIEGDLTVQELLDLLFQKYDCLINLISLSSSGLDLFTETHGEERKKQKLTSVVEMLTKQKIPSYKTTLELEVVGTTSDKLADIAMPKVIVQFRKGTNSN